MTATPDNVDWIVDTTAETFEADVLERSKTLPVIVDFWATWCQPCLMLKPIIEKVARDAGGKFALVKVDIDQLQQVAGQYGINSVPTVLAFVDGQPVDGFQGMAPEEQLKEWTERVLLTSDLARAETLIDDDPAAAEDVYRRALEQEAGSVGLQVGLGRALLAQGKNDEARQILEQLEAEEVQDEGVEALRAKLEFGSHRADDLQELRDAVAGAPDDLAAQKSLADALAAKGDFEEALEICLKLIETEPKGVGDEARQLMLDVFRVLPDGSDIVKTYRARLTALLF